MPPVIPRTETRERWLTRGQRRGPKKISSLDAKDAAFRAAAPPRRHCSVQLIHVNSARAKFWFASDAECYFDIISPIIWKRKALFAVNSAMARARRADESILHTAAALIQLQRGGKFRNENVSHAG